MAAAKRDKMAELEERIRKLEVRQPTFVTKTQFAKFAKGVDERFNAHGELLVKAVALLEEEKIERQKTNAFLHELRADTHRFAELALKNADAPLAFSDGELVVPE